jgi:Zn finger protein HypA/HybF involved in hydrogenase expression
LVLKSAENVKKVEIEIGNTVLVHRVLVLSAFAATRETIASYSRLQEVILENLLGASQSTGFEPGTWYVVSLE